MKTPTATEENYLKAVYKFSGEGETVATNTLANHLKTTPASVTDMIKKLSEKGLVEYQPYKGVSLSAEGEIIALRIIRKHRLWEVFLVKILDFSWDKVHDTAEQLEHIDSPELVDKLEEFLGNPKFDPHGDPIPSKTGKFLERITYTLSELQPGETGLLAGVLNHAPEFLQYLDKIGLGIGVKFTLTETISFANSVAISTEKKDIILSGEAADHLIVTKEE